MVENPEFAPQESGEDESMVQNPSHKEHVVDKMETQSSPDNEIHNTGGEHHAETQIHTNQSPGASVDPNDRNSSTVQQQSTDPAEVQTVENNSNPSLKDMSDEEFQKMQEEQHQKDERAYQKAKEKLQSIQEDESQTADSELDQDEENDQGIMW